MGDLRLRYPILATVALALLGAVLWLGVWPLVEVALNWYPDLNCSPPSLDHELADKAFAVAARDGFHVMPDSVEFEIGRDTEGFLRWPFFVAMIRVQGKTDAGIAFGQDYMMEGNGCGLTFTNEAWGTVDIALPELTLWAVHRL